MNNQNQIKISIISTTILLILFIAVFSFRNTPSTPLFEQTSDHRTICIEDDAGHEQREQCEGFEDVEDGD